MVFYFFFSSRRRHTRFDCDWSSDVCSSDLPWRAGPDKAHLHQGRWLPEVSRGLREQAGSRTSPEHSKSAAPPARGRRTSMRALRHGKSSIPCMARYDTKKSALDKIGSGRSRKHATIQPTPEVTDEQA